MIKEPLETELNSIDPNKLNILSSPKTEFESKLSLLYVLLNSREGELIYKKDFGVNGTSILPENMTDDQLKSFEYQVVEIINDKLKTYLPEFKVKNVEAYVAENVYKSEGGVVVMLTFVYNNKFIIESITLIKGNDKFGTLFGKVRKGSAQDNETSDGLSNRIILNLIDAINEQLRNA